MAQEDPSARLNGVARRRFGEVQIRDRGRLLPSKKEAGLYFITFHLADALPRSVVAKIAERRRILETANQDSAHLPLEQRALLTEFSHSRIEEYFDRGAGSCPFNDQRIAGAVAAALRFREGLHYWLLAWCVMPNHVHVVVRLIPGHKLDRVVSAWKVFSAKAAKHALGRKGCSWRREYYDRLIRSGDELSRAIRYVVENPDKAGLKNWIWVWSAAPASLATKRPT